MDCVGSRGVSFRIPSAFLSFPSFFPFKMYSCYDAYVVYGVMEGDRNMVLAKDWLEVNFPDVGIFASDVVRNCMGNAVYGCTVRLNAATGQALATDAQKECIQMLYTLLENYWKEIGTKYDTKYDMPRMGYFTVVAGDYEQEHTEYIPEC